MQLGQVKEETLAAELTVCPRQQSSESISQARSWLENARIPRANLVHAKAMSIDCTAQWIHVGRDAQSW